MRRLVRRPAAPSALTLAASADASDSSVVYDGGRVAVGDLELDLRAKCGEPALRDARDASTVTLEDGRVVSVDRGGYGHAR